MNEVLWYLLVGFVIAIISVTVSLYKAYKENYTDECITEQLGLQCTLFILITFAYPIMLFIILIYGIILMLNKLAKYVYLRRTK